MLSNPRNYAEAIKCYLNALRIDNDNLQILRDLSLLQIQMRDLPGFVETRRKLVTLKSANRLNWIAYAVGNHLEGRYTKAVQVYSTAWHAFFWWHNRAYGWARRPYPYFATLWLLLR